MVRLFLWMTVVLTACELKPPHLELEIRDPMEIASGANSVLVSHGGGWSVSADLGEGFPARMTLHTDEPGRQVVLWVDALDPDGQTLARGNTLAVFPPTKRGSATVDLSPICSVLSEWGDPCALADPEPGVGRCFVGECLRSECGDGVVNTVDEEICDDGNTMDGDGCSADCRRFQLCGDGVIDADFGEVCDDANLNPNDGCYVSLDATDPNACTHRIYTPGVLAGAGVSEGNPIEHRFALPMDIEVGPLGTEWYVADPVAARVYKITPSRDFWSTSNFGSVEGAGFAPVAGTGFDTTDAPFGDGGPAGAARLIEPVGLAVDALGNVYIADRGAHCIRRLDLAQRIDTVAGLCGSPRDVGTSEPYRLAEPIDVAVDGTGALFVAEASGVISRVLPDTALALPLVEVTDPWAVKAVAVNPMGEELVWIERTPATCIGCSYELWMRRVQIAAVLAGEVGNVVSTQVAMGGYMPTGCIPGDVCPEPSEFPVDLVIRDGVYYVSDPLGRRVYRVNDGLVEPFAGVGSEDPTGCDNCALAVELEPTGLALDPTQGGGLLIVSPTQKKIHGVDLLSATDHAIAPAAGAPTRPAGEGTLATSVAVDVAKDSGAFAIGAIDPTTGLPELFFANADDKRVRHVAPYPEIVTTALELELGGTICGLTSTQTGTLLVGHSGGIVELTPNAGGFVSAELTALTGLSGIEDLFAAPDGWIYVYRDRRVQRFQPDGTGLEDVAGDGSICASPPNCGDGGPAADAQLASQGRVVVASDGSVFITDPELGTVRRIFNSGVSLDIERVAGGGGDCAGDVPSCVDSKQAVNVDLATPMGIAIDDTDRLFVATADDGVLWRIDADGSIHWVAGISAGLRDPASGDGGPPRDADLGMPTRVSWLNGALFVLARDVSHDVAPNSGRVRRIVPALSMIHTAVGAVDAPGNGLVLRSEFAAPFAIAPLLLPGCVGEPSDCMTTSFLITDPPSGQVRFLDVEHVRSVVGYPDGQFGEVAPARYAQLLAYPTGLAFALELDSVFIAETDGHAILRVQYDQHDWPLSTYSGSRGEPGAANGVSTARFERPMGLTLHQRSGTLYVADTGNHAIRAIDLGSGEVTTVAGMLRQRGPPSYGAAGFSYLNAPEAVLVVNRTEPDEVGNRVRDGSLFIADTANHVVRLITPNVGIDGRISPEDSIETIAGTGEPSNVDMGVDTPRGLTIDAVGNLYIAAHRSIRLLPYYDATTGVARPELTHGVGISDWFGTLTSVYGPDVSEGYPAAVTQCLTGLTVTPVLPEGQWVIALDGCTGLLVALQPGFDNTGAPEAPP